MRVKLTSFYQTKSKVWINKSFQRLFEVFDKMNPEYIIRYEVAIISSSEKKFTNHLKLLMIQFHHFPY